MKDKMRILSMLTRIFQEHPELRFGQVIECLRQQYFQHDLFYIEDDKFLAMVEEYIKNINS